MTTFLGRPHLSIVVPAFNEEERLGSSLPRIRAFVEQRCLEVEILVCDDGSTDGSCRVAEELLRGSRGRVLRSTERHGKGHAVRTGALESCGRWVLICDADLSTPIEQYTLLADAARDRDLDLVLASREHAQARIESPQNPARRCGARGFNLLTRAIMGLSWRDTQCGFKLFDRERTLPILRRMVIDGPAWDVELLFLCERRGLRVGEVAVTWSNHPSSLVRPAFDGPRALIDLLRIRWGFRRGRYNPQRSDAAQTSSGAG